MERVHDLRPAAEPDPIPLTGHKEPVAFPVDALPAPFAAMVAAVAEATQTDPAMAGTSALTVLSAVACGRAEIEARSGWREPLVLMTATVARPGERKSAVQAMMSAPVLDAEQDLAAAAEPLRIEAETTKQIAHKAAEAARMAAGKTERGDRDDKIAEAVSAASFAEGLMVPAIPRLVADDITPEAAASVLAEQGGRLAIISAEGGIFDVIAGRYSGNVPNLDVFLKGHAGDPLRVDRRGRPPEYVRRPALSIGLMIQPAVLAAIGRQQSFRGRGLLARFLFSIPTSKVGRRLAGADPVPVETAQAYEAAVESLVRALAGWASDPAILMLSEPAAAAVVEVERTIEPQLGEDGALGALADWGSKLVGAILRITALLHLGDLGADKAIRTPIPVDTLNRGIEFGAYFRAQAVSAFAEMQVDEDTAAAVYLLQRIVKNGEATISVRDMQRAAKRFKTRAELDVPLQRLIDTGWLIPIELKHDGPGRPPSPIFTVHPQAFDGHQRSEASA